MIKKILIASILLFLLTGIVSANENVTDHITSESHESTVKENIIVNDTPDTGIAKKTSEISIKKTTGKEKTNVKIKAKLKDGNGNAIKNSKITFKIKGKTYTAKTDKNGLATLIYKLPKAKHIKTTYSQKGNIVTKKVIYKSVLNVKVTYKGSDEYNSTSKTSKVISKKTVAKKYLYKNTRKIAVLPVKKGDYSYKRGSVTIQIIYEKEGKMDNIWVAADKTKSYLRLNIATKLHYKDKNGKWKWESKWKATMSDHDIIVLYYDKLPKFDLIKVRYDVPSYKLLKKVEY